MVAAAAAVAVVAGIGDVTKIKGDAREETHIALMAVAVPVVGVFLEVQVAVVETLELLELLVQMDLVVPDGLGKDHKLVFPVQVVLEDL